MIESVLLSLTMIASLAAVPDPNAHSARDKVASAPDKLKLAKS